MTPEQIAQLNEATRFMNSLKRSTTIPNDVDGAFRDRLGGEGLIADDTSKSLTSEQHGSAAVGLKNPEKWLKIIDDEGETIFVAGYKP